MMYMSGGGIQIFSIMSVWFLLKQAVSGMMGVDKGASTALTLPARPSRSSSTAADSPSHSCAAFAPYEAASKPKPGAPKTEPQSFLEQKIVYVICQFGLLVRPCSLPCALPPLSRHQLTLLSLPQQAVGLWKCDSMGLLPKSAEDWAPVFGQFLGAGPLDAPAPGFMPVKVVPAPPLSSAVA